jgi:uncharacterized protein (TIGR03382 family)
MDRSFWWKSLVSAALMLVSAHSLRADMISFSGVFTQDDNILVIPFRLDSTTAVVLRTWSFAGGVNANSQTIPAGGFAPVLSLFDETGSLLASDHNGGTGACGPRAEDPASHFCWDAYLDPTLTAGNYTLTLTEDDNIAAGATLADGFTEEGNGNFTGPLFLGPGGTGLSFILADGSARTAQWAVDLEGVSAAYVVPEPAPALLAFAGLLWLLGRRRKIVPAR